VRDLSVTEYRALAEFRREIRLFLHFSEDQVRTRGLEPQQHQLLLAIKGLPAGTRATVELVDRLQRQGHVARSTSREDHRQVMVRLTPSGSSVLRKLSLAHHEELETAGPRLARALRRLMRSKPAGGNRAA
jgi:DNA-binding MarR family transcriptional regulator